MATAVYYFSGTGNSLIVARDIAQRLDGQLIPIAAMRHTPQISLDAEVIGIVFPVHNVVNGGVPSIVRSFLERLVNLSSTYIFAVCTCGAGSGDALVNTKKLIEARGGKLAAGYTIKMPFNCPPFTERAEQLKRFGDWNQKLLDICAAVNSRQEAKIKTVNSLVKALTYPLGRFFKRSILNNYRRMAQIPNVDFDEAVSLVDHSYYVDDRCDGCGVCMEVCPVDNIEIIADKPVWLHHCESCLACFVWCPHQAIYGGILGGKTERYHHPDVKLRDMIN